MISIVVPTMWFGECLRWFLPEAQVNPWISEVILINNAFGSTPTWFIESGKIKVIDFGGNIYVNPAWNVGVDRSASDLICIMNDDIRFDMGVFEFMSDKMGSDLGPAGPVYQPVTGPMQVMADPVERWSMLFGTASEGWGTLMFINRANWIPIPNDLLIFNGDDWIYDNSWHQGSPPRTIRNLSIVSQGNRGGTTSLRPEFNSIRDSDRQARSRLNTIWPKPG